MSDEFSLQHPHNAGVGSKTQLVLLDEDEPATSLGTYAIFRIAQPTSDD
jgi:hypothetical protein